MPRHPDFERIYRAFMRHYCGSADNECEKGKQMYYAWLNKLGLDDTKPYAPQVQFEAFNWAEPTISFLREEGDLKLYKCIALVPITSMNYNVYTEDELLRGARTLIGVPVNINHIAHMVLDGVHVVDAEYEDGAVECIIAVSPDAKCPVTNLPLFHADQEYRIIDMLDHSPDVPEELWIYHVSIEASCRLIEPDDEAQGKVCRGLKFTGLALLTKKALPGVPLTRLEPIEALIPELHATPSREEVNKEMSENQEAIMNTCALCGRALTDYVLLGPYKVHPKCANNFWKIAQAIFHFERVVTGDGEESDLIQVWYLPTPDSSSPPETGEKEMNEEKTMENQPVEDKAAEQVSEGVVPFKETPKAPEDREWDADAAERRIREWAGGPDKENIDWAKYRQGFAWYNSADPENFGSYKLPHHDVIDGKLVVVWRGVTAAMQALLGARGGVDIPAEDRRSVYNHLAKHYRQFDREPPEFHEAIEKKEKPREEEKSSEAPSSSEGNPIEELKAKIDEILSRLDQIESRLPVDEEDEKPIETEEAPKTEEKTEETVDEETHETQESDTQKSEEDESKLPTKFDIITRVKELQAQGKSQRDAWRLACFELLDYIYKRSES